VSTDAILARDPSLRVEPPSSRAETIGVARAAFHIVFWSALFVSAQTSPSAGAAPNDKPVASPYERRFQDLPFADQRTFRSVQEGLAEAERLRATSGAWPTVEELARRGVPPFAPDPLDRARYTWRFFHAGPNVDYVGTPDASSGREAFFVILAEPDPGTLDDPRARVDEVHHRLQNGPMIHAYIWMGPPLANVTAAFSVLPVENGYRQILTGQAR
jgi:hypothetical protein